MERQTLKLDIMRPAIGGCERFITTLRYPHNPLYKVDINALYKWVTAQRPSLKGKPFNCYIDDTGIKVLYS